MLAVEVGHNETQLQLGLLELPVSLSNCLTSFLDLAVSSDSAGTSIYAFGALAC